MIFTRRSVRLMPAIAVIAACMGASCRKGMPLAPRVAVELYFNSFESPDDAKNWSGVTPQMFIADPAPGMGGASLQIGGGCIQPTAWLVLPAAVSGGWYTLSCWGKIDQENQSGRVVLRIDGAPEGADALAVVVKDRSWTRYVADGMLYCPKGNRLRIELIVGGIVFVSMHVDGLTVERVGK